jgi:hypothetical protein
MWLPSVPWHELVVMTNGKEFIQDAKILILSYDLLTRQTDVLKRMNFGMLILVCSDLNIFSLSYPELF